MKLTKSLGDRILNRLVPRTRAQALNPKCLVRKYCDSLYVVQCGYRIEGQCFCVRTSTFCA